MITVCEECNKPIKEVGRLFPVKIGKMAVLRMCKSCRNKYKMFNYGSMYARI